MRYLSVCSGIEAASVAWHHLGWTPVGFSEIEPFPAAVLKHRFPHVPNYGDMTKFEEWPIEPGTIDLLVGGTPCQSFSVAGLRKGLEDPRGNLMLTYLAIAARLKPRWVVWENVPGVLSSNGGRDFGTFLSALGQLGYGWCYRCLDAQYVRVGRWPRAVPQRRRRVFVVGCLGDGAAAAEVLALREGLQRHLEASGKARKGAAADAEGGSRGGCWWAGSDCAGTLTKHNAGGGQRMPDKDNLGAVLQLIGATDVSDALVARNNQTTGFQTDVVATPTVYRWQNDRDGLQQDDAVAALRASAGSSGFHEMNHPVIAQPVPIQDGRGIEKRQNGMGVGQPGDPAYTVDTTAAQAVAQPVAFTKSKRAQSVTDDETWVDGQVNPTLSLFDQGDTRATTVAVAFANRTRDGVKVPEVMADGVSPALTNPGGGGRSDAINVAVAPTMAVRRLTARECERLQGFPLSWQIVTIEACFDHHQGHVHAVVSCRSALGNASPVGENERWQHAPTAPSNSLTSQAKHESLAALSVLTNYEAELLEIRSLGKLLWSADGAARPKSYHLSMPAASIARELAQHAQELVQAVQDGKAELRLSMMRSIPAKPGNKRVKRCGDAISESVAAVINVPAPDTFTTSDLGQLRPTSDSASTTSCCSVFHAIAGCIPSATIPNSFSVEIAVGTPWTLIPWRGKPAEQCPDGPRYKALGNSMACNCMAWIGERIAKWEAAR